MLPKRYVSPSAMTVSTGLLRRAAAGPFASTRGGGGSIRVRRPRAKLRPAEARHHSHRLALRRGSFEDKIQVKISVHSKKKTFIKTYTVISTQLKFFFKLELYLEIYFTQ